jgi:hypothetical protein
MLFSQIRYAKYTMMLNGLKICVKLYKMLTITWHHFAQDDHRRQAVEGSYQKKLMELCGTEDKAEELLDAHNRVMHPFTIWHKFNDLAHMDATKDLLPSERQKSRFTVRFT